MAESAAEHDEVMATDSPIPQQVYTTDATYCCGVCYGIYEEETDEVETWIGCEHCDAWFHATCLGLYTAGSQ